MAHLSLSLLGGFEATLDGKRITRFPSDKVRALLAYLAVEADRPHRREALAALLWPDYPQSAALTNLRRVLTSLRDAIGDRDAQPPFLLISREAIQFNRQSDYWLDVQLLREAGEGESASGERLAEVADLYHGDFLEGLALKDSPGFDDWSLLVRERLQQQALAVLRRLAEEQEWRGKHERACAYARRRVELAPWQEEAHQQLMRLLGVSGQRGAALAQYESCRRALQEGLGVEPGEETVALYERIRDGEIGAAPQGEARPANLPISLTPFIGRQGELSEIIKRLQDPQCRLLALVGPGGSGKTRLAIEAAARLPMSFRHGIHFVPLSPVQSAEGIVPAIAQAVGFSFYASSGDGPPRSAKEQLLDYLREKEMLLLLDSHEHLLEGARLLADILRSAPAVKALVTTRARLNLPGETLYAVAGMRYPTPAPTLEPGSDDFSRSLRGKATEVATTGPSLADYSAVDLFLQSARQVRTGYEPTPEELRSVVQVCQMVEGMPLAILLAASWMKMLSPGEIAAQIAGEDGRGIDFLAAEWQGVPERERSMRAVFDHSWRLLMEREQGILMGLSVFRGGCTATAAQEVTGATLRDLLRLVDRSLLQRTVEGRYGMHDLLRHYALGRLGQSPDRGEGARDRHAAYYVGALQAWEKELFTPRQEAVLREMDGEVQNLDAAWERAVERDRAEWLDRCADGLGQFYHYRYCYEEGEALFGRAAAALRARGEEGKEVLLGVYLRVLAKVVAWQGHFNLWMGRFPMASALLQEGLKLLEEAERVGEDVRREKAHAWRALGDVFGSIQYEEKQAFCKRALALSREVGDRLGTAKALEGLGAAARFRGCFEEARRLHEEELAICRELGSPRETIAALRSLYSDSYDEMRLDEAEPFLREANALWAATSTFLAASLRRTRFGCRPRRFSKSLGPVVSWLAYSLISASRRYSGAVGRTRGRKRQGFFACPSRPVRQRSDGRLRWCWLLWRCWKGGARRLSVSARNACVPPTTRCCTSAPS